MWDTSKIVIIRIIGGVYFCQKQIFFELKPKENRFLYCFKLRTALMEKSDRFNLFDEYKKRSFSDHEHNKIIVESLLLGLI